MGIADRIRMLCETNGITINKLEKSVEIGRGNIARWDKHNPNVQKVQAVADYFGVTTEYILTGNEKKPATTEGSELRENAKKLMDLTSTLDDDDVNILLEAAKAMKARRAK